MEVLGTVVSGSHGEILIRQKSGAEIELGDLLVVDQKQGYSILQVYDLAYGSQISEKHLHMISGMKLEGYAADLDFMDPALRNYVLVSVKALANIKEKDVRIPKTLPPFMNTVRLVEEKDLSFLSKPDNPLFVGKIRSGSKVFGVDVYLDGVEVFTHHVIVPATTGRGKSNLVKVMLWGIIDKDYCGILVLDPHDEYYGRHGKGLKDNPSAKDRLLYYSPKPTAGGYSLIINLDSIKPWHFRGIVSFTEAQHEANAVAYNQFGNGWLRQIVMGTELENVDPRTQAVLRRRMDATLGIYYEEGEIRCRTNAFSDSKGSSTLKDILAALESGKKVILDTSRFSDEVELLTGSIILHEVLWRYRSYKQEGTLEEKPVIAVAVEEAPRVLSGDVLTSAGDNIYSDIAREGRKFKVGLIAITQLTSVIPKTVLANINTKIILGNELAGERKAIIDTASQDLSTDDQNIASLDKGEAIISSNFTKFAVPIQIPLFEQVIMSLAGERKEARRFVG